MKAQKSTSRGIKKSRNKVPSIDWFFDADVPDEALPLFPENALGRAGDGRLFTALKHCGKIKRATIKPIEPCGAVDWMINIQKVNSGSSGTGVELFEVVRELLRKISFA